MDGTASDKTESVDVAHEGEDGDVGNYDADDPFARDDWRVFAKVAGDKPYTDHQHGYWNGDRTPSSKINQEAVDGLSELAFGGREAAKYERQRTQ